MSVAAYKVLIEIRGKDYNNLADAAQHAVDQLRLGVPSERIHWEDGSSCDYTIHKMTPEDEA